MKKYILLIQFSLLFLVGCAGSKSKPMSNKGLPDWFLNPPKFENKFVGVGDASRPQFSLSKQVATERARVEIARAVETTITSALNQHMKASGLGAEASATEFTESVSKSLASTTLQGCVIEKTEILDGRVFVMVVYDANKAKEAAKAAARVEAKKEEALYNEFKARQAFDSLDQAIDRMRGSTSVSKNQ